MALYLKEVALLETTTNTLLKLTNVMEGVNNSAVFGYEVENINIAINANQTEQIVNRHTFAIQIKDDQDATNQAILTAWANNPELRFKASGYSGDTFFLWDEPVPIVFNRQYDKIVTRSLLMTLDAKPGFNGADGLKKLPVYAGQNIVAIYKAWEGSTTLLNGFMVSGTMVTAQTGGSLTLTRGADAAAYVMSQPIFFPFNGIRLTSSFTQTEQYGTADIGIRFLDISSVQIDIYTSSFSGSGFATVRRSYDAILPTPTNVVYIQFYIGPSLIATDQTVFNAPAIRLGYETAFVN